jgi:hypothetical protein
MFPIIMYVCIADPTGSVDDSLSVHSVRFDPDGNFTANVSFQVSIIGEHAACLVLLIEILNT